jgi:nitrogen regulatory protein PII
MNKKLLMIVTNLGFANEVIKQSKLSGAQGATILSGRGATGHAETFMGMNVMAEKEIILIVLDEKIATDAMTRISGSLGIETNAGSICFLLPVDRLTKFNG